MDKIIEKCVHEHTKMKIRWKRHKQEDIENENRI